MDFIVIGDSHYPADGEDARQIVAGWVRARVYSLREVQAGRLSVERFRDGVAEFRRRHGDDMNRRVNDLAVCALARLDS